MRHVNRCTVRHDRSLHAARLHPTPVAGLVSSQRRSAVPLRRGVMRSGRQTRFLAADWSRVSVLPEGAGIVSMSSRPEPLCT
jgi:hypothetical protein